MTKKNTILIMVVFLFLGNISFSQYESSNSVSSGEKYYYLGAVLSPNIKPINFTTFDIYDFIDDRVIIDLEEVSKSGPMYGILGGYSASFGEKLDAFVELQLVFSGGTGFDGYVGGTYNFLAKENFSLGLTPKIGFAYRSKKLGNAKVAPNSGANNILQVNLDNSNIVYPEDKLSATAAGFAYHIGIKGKLKLTTKTKIITQLGWGGAALSKMKVSVYNSSQPKDDDGKTTHFELDMSSKYCVERGTTDKIDFTPELKMGGIHFSIGVVVGI